MVAVFRLLATTTVLFALTAPAALAHDQGQGWYGETTDKVVTNAGFIVIAFFPLFVLFASLLQWRLDKRKDARKKAAKARAKSRRWQAGW
jgi:hypothetical protein